MKTKKKQEYIVVKTGNFAHNEYTVVMSPFYKKESSAMRYAQEHGMTDRDGNLFPCYRIKAYHPVDMDNIYNAKH